MKFTIIAQQGCEYCAKARELLFDHGHTFDYLTLDNKPEAKDLVRSIGFPTVPIIFVRKTDKGYPTLIGTYEDLKAFLSFNTYLKAPLQ
jgi:glutaredoxin